MQMAIHVYLFFRHSNLEAFFRIKSDNLKTTNVSIWFLRYIYKVCELHQRTFQEYLPFQISLMQCLKMHEASGYEFRCVYDNVWKCMKPLVPSSDAFKTMSESVWKLWLTCQMCLRQCLKIKTFLLAFWWNLLQNLDKILIVPSSSRHFSYSFLHF